MFFVPADINETLECWEIALKSKNTPSVIALSRQKLPYILVRRFQKIIDVKKELMLSR